MRLSDKQYNAFVRVGILIVVVAVFAFDRTPSTYQPLITTIAVIGAIVGFFPFVTSRPFHSSEEDESDAGVSESLNRDKLVNYVLRDIQVGMDVVSETQIRFPEACNDPYPWKSYRDIYAHLRHNQVTQRRFRYSYDIDHDIDAYIAYIASSLINRDGRSARVKEVHDLIDKLRGTSQTFSVELTSSNSIIVHCEGLSPESILLDKYEREMQNFNEPTENSMSLIQ